MSDQPQNFQGILIKDAAEAFAARFYEITARKPTLESRIVQFYWNLFYKPFYYLFTFIFYPFAAIIVALLDVAKELQER